MTVLTVYFLVGLTYNFIQSDFSEGIYLGCNHSCANAIDPVNGLGTGIFGGNTWAFLQNGDIIGFFLSFGLKIITSANIFTAILSFIGAALLLVFSFGINISIPLGAGYSIDDSTAKLCRSLSIGLFLWGILSIAFGAWTDALGFGMGIIINFLLGGLYFYGIYWRGDSQV